MQISRTSRVNSLLAVAYGKTIDFFDKDGRFSNLWNSLWFGIPLWCSAAASTLWWLFHLPSPGKAIGALAVVAGIMSVREIKVLGKVTWVVLLVCMLVIEFRSIDKDRTENDAEQKKFFDEQRQGFKEVTNQAKINFQETTKGLETAITSLNTTLGIATNIFQQTAPHAAILPTTFTVVNPKTVFTTFNSSAIYRINFFSSNNGSEQGMVKRRIGRMYVAKPDDRHAQEELISRFEKDWKETLSTGYSTVELPGAPSFWSEFQSISKEDEDNLKFNRNTLYFIRRIEYADKTGTWWSDRCDHYQVNGGSLEMKIIHPCLVLMNSRYRAK